MTTPAFRIEANGGDITQLIADRLLSMRLNEQAEQQSDSLEITLDDRDKRIPVPSNGTWLRVWLGYSSGGRKPVYMGAFAVDEVELSMGPRSMVIKATASNTAPTLQKEQRTKSWHNTTLGAVVQEIAGRHNVVPVIKGALASQQIKHEDQTNESDQAFLTRLAEKFKATIKPADGRLVVVPRGATDNAGSVTIRQEEVTNWRATLKNRGAYGGVKAKWLDRTVNKEKVVTAGESGGALPVFEEKQLYKTQAEAQKAAESRLQSLRAGEVRVNITLPGRPDVNAEGMVTLTGFRGEVDGTWNVKNVTHDLGSSGYVTTVECGTQGEENNDWTTGRNGGGSTTGTIARTGSSGDSTGPHLDARWADGRPISAADADRYLRINGRAPSSYGVTSSYGPRNLFGRSFHYGIDFGTPSGSSVTLINGASYGRNLGYTGAGGYAVEINTPQGPMRLLHLQAGSAR
ncbi:MAG: late control protein D [Synechococcaceae bacterium WB4_1_0192]|nr:late control protein D [Synechococcaceae bacterium WB4_1_0192]